MTLTVGSTFTGVGGADLGLERAGMQIVWQCELDAWKRSVLAAHWPDVHIYPDITTLDNPPAIDMLIGGFPCQDLSVAGKRKGFNGERSVLAFEFLRLAESLRPRWLLMENVPGLLSSNGGRDMARLLDEMGAAGYGGWAYRILDARYFGVPQRRRRVFICARRADLELDSGAAAKLALRALWEGSGGDPTPGWPPREIAATRAGAGAEVGSGIAGSLTKRYGKGVNTTCDDGAMVAFRKAKRAASDQDDETWVADGAANTLNAFDAGDTRTTHAVIEVAGALDRQAGGPDDNSAQAGHLIPMTASTLQARGKTGGADINTEGAAGGHLIPVTSAFKAGQGASAGSIGYEKEMAPTLTAAPSGSNQVPTIHTSQTFSVYPEGGNGADIAAAEVERSPSLTKVKSERGIHVAHTLTSAGHDASEDGTGRGTPLVPHVSPTLTKYNLDSRSPQSEEQQRIVGAVHEAQMSVRRLTPVECERLMGWPDDWTAPEGIKAPDSKRYAACGDGIVSHVAYWIGCRIQMIEDES